MFSENNRSTASVNDDIYNTIENLIAAVDHMKKSIEDPDVATDEYMEIMSGFQDVRRKLMVRFDLYKYSHCPVKHSIGALASLQDAFMASNDDELLQDCRDLASYVARLIKLGSKNGSEITPCASCEFDKDVNNNGFIKEGQ